jgi:hypothetical protein
MTGRRFDRCSDRHDILIAATNASVERGGMLEPCGVRFGTSSICCDHQQDRYGGRPARR